MTDPTPRPWGLGRALWSGVGDLFPTRKVKMAMWGLVGLGVLTTYLELAAAQLFSDLVRTLDDEPARHSVMLLTAFVLAFGAVRGIQYFHSVYRITVFERALRKITVPSRAAEAWRWPMAIALVGMLGQLARLVVVVLTVGRTAWQFGVVLVVCSLIAMVIVNRAGRQQYAVHHQFAAAKKAGNPPSPAERIGTRIRAGERAGLIAGVPVLLFIVALGAGAASGRVPAHSALVLFVAGRMASNMYGNLSNSTMRYIRAEVNVETFGGGAPARPAARRQDREVAEPVEGPDPRTFVWEPPGQAYARLADNGRYVGDMATIGQLARQHGFGARPGTTRTVSRPDRLTAVGPNQVWWHDEFALPLDDEDHDVRLQTIVDVFSRSIVASRIGPPTDDHGVIALFDEACDSVGIARDGVTLHSTRTVVGTPPNLYDLLRTLGVMRTLTWFGPGIDEIPEAHQRPRVPSSFADEDAARTWVAEFTAWYNRTYYEPTIGYRHPADIHAGLADAVSEIRQRTIDDAAARGRHVPKRFPDEWSPPLEAWVDRVALATVQRAAALDEDRLDEEDDV